jgi:hypothetical protein
MRFFLLTGYIFVFFGGACISLEKQVPGTYIERSLGDTLQVSSLKTYEYNERLITQVSGWTEGIWELHYKDILFRITPRPLMGLRLKMKQDSTADHPVFLIFLGDSPQPVSIKSIAAYREGFEVPLDDAIIAGNHLELRSTNVDSIEISTEDFIPFTIPRKLFSNHTSRLELYPLERYYLLDKYVFRYKKRALRNINTKGAPTLFMVFEKLSAETKK